MQSITAQLHHPSSQPGHEELYCFDAPEFGLTAEPFVQSASNAIHCALRWHHGFEHFTDEAGGYRWSQAVALNFTDQEAELDRLTAINQPILELTLLRPENGGHLYHWQLMHPEEALENQDWEHSIFYSHAWLCPVLLTYFPSGAPEKFWVQVRELQS